MPSLRHLSGRQLEPVFHSKYQCCLITERLGSSFKSLAEQISVVSSCSGLVLLSFALCHPFRAEGDDFKVGSFFRRKSCLHRVALTFSAMLGCPVSLLIGKSLRVVTMGGKPLSLEEQEYYPCSSFLLSGSS